MKHCMIIDGSSLLYRAFFALPAMHNKKGVPTNAVYGFMTMLIKLMQEISPDYIVVAFDKGKHTFRNDLYEDYKGHRPSAPDDLRPQFALIRDTLAAMGILVIEQEGYEGDDIIGSLSKRFGSEDLSVSIITGDRDTLQLVDPYSTVYLTKKGISDMLAVTTQTMKALYGYEPYQVIHMKALMGDSSDNIPGVPGIGEKTALKLITAYDTVEGVYEHIEEQKGKLKERLVENKEMAFLSKELATIMTTVPVEVTIEDCVPQFDETAMKAQFDECNFTSLYQRMCEAIHGLPGEATGLSEVGGGLDDFHAYVSEHFPSFSVDVVTACTPAHIESWARNDVYLFMEESMRMDDMFQNMYVLADGTLYELSLADRECWQVLARVLPTCHAIYTNDMHALLTMLPVDDLADLDQFRNSTIYDMTLLGYMLDPGKGSYTYDELWQQYCHRVTQLLGTDTEGCRWRTVGIAYAVDQMMVAIRALIETYEAVHEVKLLDVYTELDAPMLSLLTKMERYGISIDESKLDALHTAFTAQEQSLCKEIYELAGEEFNINSPKQLGVILFERLELPIIKKTKTGYSTNAEVLEQLRTQHPIVDKILAYRGITKLISTYLEGLKKEISKETGRIHTTFNLTVTATGRLSSSNPNLQNIPIHTENGKQIRSLFVPGEGYDWLVSADYSQLELRVLAYLSQEPTLLKAFVEGEDIHRMTAAEVLGKPLEEVTSEERSSAKAVNYGIIYGISDFGLSRDLGITRKEAQAYIDRYFERYHELKAFMDEQLALFKSQLASFTHFGRVRQIPDLSAAQFMRRAGAERMAMNTLIQGTAADLMKEAMLKVDVALRNAKLKSRILLQVHDELVLEVPDQEVAAVSEILEREMCDNPYHLTIDIHKGKNWAEAK